MVFKIKNGRKLLINAVGLLLVLALALFVVFMVRAYFAGHFHSVESMQDYVEGFGLWGPLILTAFQALRVMVPVLPGFLGCIVGGTLFGPCLGFLCNYTGIVIGSLTAFYLSGRYGAPLMDDLFPGEKYRRWTEWASKSKYYKAFVAAAMLLPLFPGDYVCYLSGLVKMDRKTFRWIVLLFKPWCILAYAIAGSMVEVIL